MVCLSTAVSPVQFSGLFSQDHFAPWVHFLFILPILCVCQYLPCAGQGPNLEYKQIQQTSFYRVYSPLGAEGS